MQPPRPSERSDWVPIGRASRILGVNPGTLRQWSAAGKLHAYRTPGGHRRFSTAELASLAEQAPSSDGVAAPPLAGAILAQLRQRYHAAAHAVGSHEPWIAGLEDEARQRFRRLGEELLRSLQDYVTARGPRDRRLALQRARETAAAYGQGCREAGLEVAQAVEAYVRFRRPLLEVLAGVLAAHPEQGAQISRMMRDAERFMDEVLESVANGASPTPGRRRAS